MTKNLVLMLAAAAAAVVLTGCLDVEESVTLQRDLSGTATMRMTVDLEPMVLFMAAMQHSMSGKAGDPTPAEIEEARKGFLDKQHSEDRAKQEQEHAAQREQLVKSLPPGVRLLSSSLDEQGTKILARFQFGFDDVHKLAHLKLPDKGGAGQPGQNPYQDPFSSLQVVDEGRTLLVTLSGGDPAARLQGQAAGKNPAAGNPEMTKAFEAAFKDARFAFRLDSPFEVVETNATRRDGRVLIWEIKASDPQAKMPQTLMARLRK
jgi:hypothetical protein